MRFLIATISLVAITACAATPTAVPAGPLQTDGGFSVTLSSAWSKWPSNLNTVTKGDYITKDGPLLNRVNFVTLEDGEPLLRAARDADVPAFSAGATEIEIVDLVTASLNASGYNAIEADNIRPAVFDGRDGLRL